MGKKIAIIEDDSTMRNLLQTLLTIEGYLVVVLTVATVDGIIKDILFHQPDAILSDIHLRNMNGLNITRGIRQLTNIHQPLIVMVSGMELAPESKLAGADFFLLKPYMPDTLIQWFHDHLT